MLEITDAAENAIRLLRRGSELPESTVLRIAPIPTIDGGLAIGLAFTDGPEDGDHEVSAKADLTVFVAPELASTFDRATLEATADEEGIELELRTQADLHDHGGNGDATLPQQLATRRAHLGSPGPALGGASQS
jgi:Fe-S cluster assembly iron-binding protein IscA